MEKAFEKDSDELIEGLIEEHGITPEVVLGKRGLIKELARRVVEKALAAKLTHHFGYAKGAGTSGGS